MNYSSSVPGVAETAMTGHATPPILVLGMHRSGTSCLAGCLRQLGLNLGDDDLPPSPENPKGFQEHIRITTLDDDVLANTGNTWSDPTFDPRWTSDQAARRDRIIEEFDTGAPWGFKDPRILAVLPFWQSALDEIRPIGIIRSPAAVAASLKARTANGLTIEHGLRLWIRYNERLLDLYRANPFPIVDFDTDMAVFSRHVARIAADLGLSKDVVPDFAETKLRHRTPYLEYDRSIHRLHLELKRATRRQHTTLHALPSIDRRTAAYPTAFTADDLDRYELAQRLLQDGDEDAAIRTLAESGTDEPRLPDADEFLARLYIRRGWLDEAEKVLRSTIATDPLRPAGHALLATILLQREHFPKALEAIDKAIALNEPVARFHFTRAAILEKQGRIVEAASTTLKGLDLDPFNAGQWYRAAGHLGTLGRHKASLQCAEKAARLDTGNAAFHYQRGLAALQLKKYQTAITAFKDAVRLRPDNGEYFLLLAAAHDQSGDLDTAIDNMNKAIELAPDNSYYHHCLGNFLTESGRIAPALASQKKAVALDPENTAAIEAVKNLSGI